MRAIFCVILFFSPGSATFPMNVSYGRKFRECLKLFRQIPANMDTHCLLVFCFFLIYIYITNVMEDMDIHSTGSLFFSIYKKKKWVCYVLMATWCGCLWKSWYVIYFPFLFGREVRHAAKPWPCALVVICHNLVALHSANAVSVTFTLKSLHPRQKLSKIVFMWM